jgi:SAM-dependent methyltransferase
MRKLFGLALGLAVIGTAGLVPVSADEKQDEPKIVVPFVPTHPKVVAAMLKLADVKEGDTVYDLGCGDGRIVIAAVKDFKAKRGLGLDFNPERLKDCQKSMEEAKLTPEQKKKITFKQGDVLKMKPEDFKGVDVVTLYLLPSVNRELKPVLQKGLKPGARVVSHDFDMGEDWKEDKKESVEADRTHTVYLWTIKEKK